MSIATALQSKIAEKEAIRLAIESKGITVDTSVLLSGYPTKIDEISTGGGEGYQRPADWLEIDSLVVDLDEKFVGLYAIYEDSNFISLSAAGNYTVDWGDGVVENYNSGIQCYHQYDYADFIGTESTRGYRQAVVTVTPDGGTLTNIDLLKKHSQPDLQLYTTNWLDIKMSGSNVSSIVTSGYLTVYPGILEQFSFIGTNNLTSTYRLFYRCHSFKSLLELDTSSVTNMGQMFYQNHSLIEVPLFDTSSATDMSNMFAECSSLITIPLFNTSSVITMFSMFRDCYSLTTIPLIDTTGTNKTSMFSKCIALQSIPLISGGNVSGMFSLCASLSKGAILNTKLTISYEKCKLSQSALVDIFNGLATVVGQTITITGNWGAANLTVGERAIATDKGWVISG
jgi:surface protein